MFSNTELMCLSITLCNGLWRILRLVEVGNIFKVKNVYYCDVGKIYALRNLKFFPDVDFAVLIITD